MNKIVKHLFLFCAILLLANCEDSDSPEFNMDPSALEILTPISGTQLELDPTNESNTALTIVWQNDRAATSYNIEMAAGATEFATPYVAATTSETTVSWSVVELNTFLSEVVGLEFNLQQSVDIRVVSDTGFISNTSTIIVTPYGLPDLPRLAVPGNHQGWNPSEAEVDFVPYIAAPLSDDPSMPNTNYEGYMWLDGEFKFVEPNAAGEFVWGNTDWEDDGTFSGVMSTNGPGNFPSQPAGFYYVSGDTGTGNYNIEAVSWGIIGAATPTGWDSDTDLIYNPSTRALEVEISLTNGEPFKFRGNNAWGNYHDLGTIDEDGYLQNGGDLVFDQPTGMYVVQIDMNNPRRYILTITPSS